MKRSYSLVGGLVIGLTFCLFLRTNAQESEDEAISNLQKYIQIRTDQPHPDYASAVEFLTQLATEIGLETQSLELVPGKPIFLAWLLGSNGDGSTILLNSHMDVVPVEPGGWSQDPFAATIERDKVYGRGTQDMKSVTIQYLEALRHLIRRGWKPDRTVLLSVVPDEEIGGAQGMGVFVESKEFQKWNISLELDEGLANPQSFMWLYYGERQPWWLTIGATDQPAHGATLPNHTAIQHLYKIEQKVLEFRKQQEQQVSQGIPLGDIIGINLVYLRSGVTKDDHSYVMNMVPGIAELGLDIRVPPTKQHSQEMTRIISDWLSCTEDEIMNNWIGNCSHYYYKFIHRVDIPQVTSKDPVENPYYQVIQQVFDELSISYKTAIFPASTDARYLRERKIPCFGFSPIHSTPVLLHDNDEYIPKDIFLKGISIYERLIEALSTLDYPTIPSCKPTENITHSITTTMPHEEL
ncbi:Aminoacylase-1 [Galdieria sulphuraria]|uniref:N-acyl-aliphatic-L-amino acid amidohydrolase n=1 Tax=Galdieria sulphuraria TaxID=130081 RepID=M2Y345_GALSU|nr:aminoacylase [Galdieria sulphuraria]EME30348.1 aminoacylase [Galdieria sulphuraria]GJD12989.1 Aminoacylase-1 [Galdieria sulphuraria]|eukprot:XP_005706868.1 aminoacylase [Galdieria sulphuraria]